MADDQIISLLRKGPEGSLVVRLRYILLIGGLHTQLLLGLH